MLTIKSFKLDNSPSLLYSLGQCKHYSPNTRSPKVSNYFPMEALALKKAAKLAEAAAARKKLEEKNKEAAREHLLRMQIYLARVSTK